MPPPYTYKASSKGEGYTSTVVESMTDFTGKTHTYTYDDNGNITSETVDGQTIRYEYDDQNRLTHYFDPIANITRIYTYDDRGNILDVKYCGYMTEEEYTAFVAEYGVDTIPSFLYTYGDSTWADLLTNYSGTNITYDELGNPLNWVGGRGITLTWENGRQLKQYKRGAVQQYDYTYNADGLRTGKTITQSGSVTKQTEYYIVNGTYIGEVSTVNGTQYVISYVYDENGAPAGINVNGSAYYFAKNLQGDIVAIMSYTGNVIARYYYDAWGDLISITDGDGNAISSSTDIANLNPFRYRGYMYDDESGFYYNSTRYYDPSVGRFLNADTEAVLTATPDQLTDKNLFAYCDNNPVVRADHGGEFWNVIIGAAIGGAISLVSSTVSVICDNAIKGEKFSLKDVGQIAISTTIGALEGAAIALCPAASVAISAVASAADTAINGVIDGDSAGEIVTNSLVSGAIGAVAGSGGSEFVKGGKLINDAAGSVGNAIRKGVHPVVKKSARKIIKKAAKKIGREYVSGQIEDFAYGGVYEFSSFYTRSAVSSYRR